MITVCLKGGLGNQMFQYALGRSLAEKNNTELCLDIGFYHKKNNSLPKREFLLDRFKITYKKLSNSTDNGQLFSPLRFFRWQNRPKVLVETSFAFNPTILEKKDNIYLDGYWQSEKYFKQIDDIIQQDFTLKCDPSPKYEDLLKLISNTQSVSIHIRRGDYVENLKTASIHGICSLNYYKKAVNYIQKVLGDIEVFVFSDDLDWVKENLFLDVPVHFMDNINDPEIDLFLMSSCKNQIIANSTFSWWAAWLNPNKEKIVIAPNRWFRDESRTSIDIIPNSWIKL